MKVEKTIRSSKVPNMELLINLVQQSNKELSVSEVGGIIYETVKMVIVKNFKNYDIAEEDAYRLATSLISSMFMTLLTIGLSEKCVMDLCKSLGFTDEESEDKDSKGAEA